MPYLPENKYTKPKAAGANEFIIRGTSIFYKGLYVETYTKTYYAGKSPMETEVVLQKVSNHKNGHNEIYLAGIGLLGTAIAGFFKKTLTKSEKENGIAKRYFVQDKNDNKIAETDKATYNQTKLSVPNRNFAEVDWIIKGPAEDKMFGNYPFEGAESKNRKTIQALETTMPGISTFVTDYKYLVEEPAPLAQPTSQTFNVTDADTQLENDRKANFDYRK
jgi:hypothetical protein